jgi:hypothetical protein
LHFTDRNDFTYTDKFLLAFPVAPEYRPRVHQEIFDLSYFSEGAFTFSSVYDMPITLRKFYLNKLSDQKKKEKEEIEKAKRKR